MDSQNDISSLTNENRVLKRRVERMTREFKHLVNLHEQATRTRDYSEREKQLQYEYNYLFLENSTDMIFVLDHDMKFKLGTRVLVNFLGYIDSSHLTDMNFKDIFTSQMPVCWLVSTEKRLLSVIKTRQHLTYTEEIELLPEPRVFNISISPAINSRGEVMGVICHMHDTTELVRIKEAAEAATKAKSSFLASMSHEIRTPMNAIKGLTELLERTELTAQQHIYVSNTIRATESLLKIIDDVLDISKLEANRYMIVNAQYDTASALGDLCNLMQPKAEAKGLYFVANIEPSIPKGLNGDIVRIKQILINIINNAIKFTHTGGISLSVSGEYKNDTYYQIYKIKDTGQGIKQEDIDKIFQAFEQADFYKNRNISGTGLGLAISKNLAELMGGCITVESDYGKGSTFTVRLKQEIADKSPIAAIKDPGSKRVLYLCDDPGIISAVTGMYASLSADIDVATDSDAFADMLSKNNYTHVVTTLDNDPDIIRKNEEALRKCSVASVKSLAIYSKLNMPDYVQILFRPVLVMTLAAFLNNELSKPVNPKKENEILGSVLYTDARVLVVDDNEINLLVASEILRAYGIEPEMASDGEQAVKLIKANKYDLVFMDHMMPGMDGLQATEIIRKQTCIEQPAIIALTANAIFGMEKMYLENGFDGYITKPIDTAALDLILAKWLGANSSN